MSAVKLSWYPSSSGDTRQLQLPDPNRVNSVTISNYTNGYIGLYYDRVPAGLPDDVVSPDTYKTIPLAGNTQVNLSFLAISSGAGGVVYAQATDQLLSAAAGTLNANPAIVAPGPWTPGPGYDGIIVSTPSIAHYWPMDDAAGSPSIRDPVGGVPGAVESATLGVPGLVSDLHTAGQTPGISAQGFEIPIGALLFPNNSMELWFQFVVLPAATSGNTACVFSNGNQTGSVSGVMFGIYVDSSNVRHFAAWNGGGEHSIAAANGAIHFLAITLDSGGNASFYLDGTLLISGLGTSFNPNPPSAVGYDVSGGISAAQIICQKLAYYSTMLTSSQIQAHYAAGK